MSLKGFTGLTTIIFSVSTMGFTVDSFGASGSPLEVGLAPTIPRANIGGRWGARLIVADATTAVQILESVVYLVLQLHIQRLIRKLYKTSVVFFAFFFERVWFVSSRARL